MYSVYMYYVLQYIISLKHSENVERFLCTRQKNQYCILVIFVPSGCTALKTGMILSWRSLHGLSNTSCFQIAVNTIHCSIHKCRLFCSIKQRRSECEHSTEMLLSSGLSSVKMEKWKTLLWSEKSKFDFFLFSGKHGSLILRIKEMRNHPTCYLCSV